MHVLGGDRASALKWLATHFAIVLNDRPLTHEDRARYAREKRLYDRDLPVARLWRRAAVALTEQTLDELKRPLVDPTTGRADTDGVQHFEAILRLLRRLEGTALVEQYRAFLRRNPLLTAGMCKAAHRRARIEERVAWRALLGVIE
jgi:hypothetical protein